MSLTLSQAKSLFLGAVHHALSNSDSDQTPSRRLLTLAYNLNGEKIEIALALKQTANKETGELSEVQATGTVYSTEDRDRTFNETFTLLAPLVD